MGDSRKVSLDLLDEYVGGLNVKIARVTDPDKLNPEDREAFDRNLAIKAVAIASTEAFKVASIADERLETLVNAIRGLGKPAGKRK